MRLNELIAPAPGFQRSINIQYDLDDPERILGYIPSSSSEAIIGDVLLSLNGQGNRASMLVGSYGSGKSHLATFLASLLGRKVPANYFNVVLDRFKNVEVRRALERELLSDKPYLIVPVTGGLDNIQKLLLRALKNTLQREGISVPVKSAYSRAIETIDRWREEFPQIYSQFERGLSFSDFGNADNLRHLLELFDPKALEYFSVVYRQLSAGAEFDSFDGDIVSIFEDVARNLTRANGRYRGLFIVVDEFNRVIEQFGNDPFISKILQDLAELANRSDEAFSMYIMLISHKTIRQYTREEIRSNTEEWLKIEGRFTLYDITRRPSERYELMSRVFVKKRPDWLDIVRASGVQMTRLESALAHLFQSALPDKPADEIERMIHDCYPLHPTLVYILPSISNRLAQNERTMFTFMACVGDSPVSRALEKELRQADYVYPYQLFDYFLVEIRRSSEPELRSNWIRTVNALQQFTDSDSATIILKTIGVLSLTGVPILCSERMVRYATSPKLSQKQFDDALMMLVERRIVFLGTTHILEVCEPVGIDLEAEIKERVDKTPFENVYNLEPYGIQDYILPHKYNHEFKMTRFLTPVYVGQEGLEMVVCNSDEFLKPGVDGIVVYVYPETSEELRECRRIASQCKDRCILIAIPPTEVHIRDLILRVRAIDDLKVSLRKSGTESAQKLLELYERDAMQSLAAQVRKVTNPSARIEYYNGGEPVSGITSETELSDYVSSLMSQVYYCTPIINNELVNKANPSKTSRRAMNTVIDEVVKGSDLLKNIRSAQDRFMFDTLFVDTGLWANGKCPGEDLSDAIRKILSEIDSYFQEAKKQPKDFADLIRVLMLRPYGLRAGVIPVFLAVVCLHYKEFIRLEDRDGLEKNLDAAIIEQIVADPSRFRLSLEPWENKHRRLVQGLASIFGVTLKQSTYELRQFDLVSESIFRWFVELPKLAREYSGVTEPAQKLRLISKIVRNNPRETLLRTLPRYLGYDDYELADVDVILHKITMAKHELDSLLHNERIKAQQFLEQLLRNHNYDGKSLVGLARNFIESPKSRESDVTNLVNLSDYIHSFQGTDEEFINGLARIICGVEIADWTEASEEKFYNELKRIIESAEGLAPSPLDVEAEIVFADSSMESGKAIIHKVDLSKTAVLLQSDLISTIRDFGNAVSQAEVKLILLNIIRGMLNR